MYHMKPKVTIIMPVFNEVQFIRSSIESVLSQTFTDYELIIIDDGSDDGSSEIIRTFHDARIKYLCNSHNIKLIATLNRGIDLAQGEYIARMDADDISLPGRLARQVEILDANPAVGVCSTWAKFIDQKGAELGVLKTPVGKRLQKLFWRPSPIVHAACMARASIFKKNRYNLAFEDAEDYELWLRLYGTCRFMNIAEPFYLIRRHDLSVSEKNRERQLRNSYAAFCSFLNNQSVSYPEFMSLLNLAYEISPFRRLQCYLLASQRTGFHLKSLVIDNRDYMRMWRSRCVSCC